MIVKNIKKLCIDNNISISALEKKVGFGNSTISKWEASSPRVDNLKKVADFLGVTVDELIKEEK